MPEHDPAPKPANEAASAAASEPDVAGAPAPPALALVPPPASATDPEPEFALTAPEPAPAPRPPTSTWDPASSLSPPQPPAPPPAPAPKPPPSSWLEVDRDHERQRRAALERQRWTEISQTRRASGIRPAPALQPAPKPVVATTLPSEVRRPVDPLAWWVILGAAILGIGLYWSATRTTLTGNVAASGPTLGNWTMNVDSCHVTSIGPPQQLTFEDSDHPSLRMLVTSDPHEPPAVQVVSAVDGQMHSVEFDRCGDDRVQTAVPASSKVLSGTLTLNCAVGQSRLTAQLNFENCR